MLAPCRRNSLLSLLFSVWLNLVLLSTTVLIKQWPGYLRFINLTEYYTNVDLFTLILHDLDVILDSLIDGRIIYVLNIMVSIIYRQINNISNLQVGHILLKGYVRWIFLNGLINFIKLFNLI